LLDIAEDMAISFMSVISDKTKERRWHQCWGGWPRTSARWNAIANIAQAENTSINSIGWPTGHQM